MVKIFPDYLRIGLNAPNERSPLARLGFERNSSARVIGTIFILAAVTKFKVATSSIPRS